MERFACVFALAIAMPSWAIAGVDVPGRGPIDKVDFERHVVGLFSKVGCNNGSCHGSFQGKNGFRLSLFGYDPTIDYSALARDNFGRRLNRIDPDQSLLLLKATGRMPHEGSVRIARDSWQHQLVRNWIAAGAKWEKGSGTVAALTLDVGGSLFVSVGETRKVTATAKFADGTEENVTPFCEFRIGDDSVAEVSPLGVVSARQPGDVSLVVVYRGVVQATRVLVPAKAPDRIEQKQIVPTNHIDREVLEKLRLLNMVPSELADDAQFLRRVTIDIIGSLPSPTEVRAFLAEGSPDKRAKKIDELLAQPLHAALWATRFSDITGNSTDMQENPPRLRGKRSQMWHDWFRKRIADNVPYDEIVRGVLTATSREGQDPDEWLDSVKTLDEQIEKGFTHDYADRQTLDLFWKQQPNPTLEQLGEKVAAAFLGVRLECAQCHKHPTDRWTQNDYRSFANIFQQVSVGTSPETRKLVDDLNAERRAAAQGKNNNQIVLVREMFLGNGTMVNARGRPMPGARPPLRDPDTNQLLAPKTLGGSELPVRDGDDLRAGLLEWMRARDNPYFARSIVNRVWAHYFGVGLVEPVDDFSIANPPTNAKLLDALARDFVEHKFDIRYLERLILNSRTYQQSSKPNETNRFDRNNFARAYIRPMLAEVVVDVLNAALETSEPFGNDAPAGWKMIEVGSSRLQNQNLAYVLRIFGKPPRTTACDCERTLDPALPQTLYRMTDPAVMTKLTAKDGRLMRLLGAGKSDQEVLDELFLATLGRFPTADDKAAFDSHRAAARDSRAAFLDTLWALINTREFILNH